MTAEIHELRMGFTLRNERTGDATKITDEEMTTIVASLKGVEDMMNKFAFNETMHDMALNIKSIEEHLIRLGIS